MTPIMLEIQACFKVKADRGVLLTKACVNCHSVFTRVIIIYTCLLSVPKPVMNKHWADSFETLGSC